MKYEVNNYTLKNDNIILLENINMILDSNISLIGTTSSGKTLLLKYLETSFGIPRIFKNDIFLHSSIEDELKYLILDDSQKKLIKDLIPDLNLKLNPNFLEKKDKIRVSIIKGLVNAKDFVSFDNILIYLEKEEQKKIIDYLNKQKINFINVTNDLEQMLWTEYTYVLNKGKIIAHGPSQKILLEEKFLKRMGFKIPFMIDLSLQLKDYGLINNIYLDKELLVKNLWK